MNQAKKLKDTLNLPQTDFSMRANAIKREPQLQRICITELWKWQRAVREGDGLKLKKLSILIDRVVLCVRAQTIPA